MAIAWVFPGQGSQKVGMADPLLNLSGAHERFSQASELLGRDLLAICQGESGRGDGPDDLNDTRNTQPALFVIESLLVDNLIQQGRDASLVAGHSLGELVALYAAGAFNLEAGLKHWAYQPVKESEPPAVSRFLSGSNWARRPLDSFIERRLRSEGLEPAPEAERETWLRRVSYGVTGLPPTSAELAAFLDDRSPRAYERVVDELIASPHYGEKWARHWLDLVRYGETRGHEFDYLIPNAFEYRDYLTRAFNDDGSR